MKKILSLMLALTMCFALTSPAFAYDTGKVGTGTTISAGGSFTAAIDTDGSLWMWGSNDSGELGNGGVGNDTFHYMGKDGSMQTVPIKVMDQVVSVSCGNGHTAAIKTDSSLWTWGNNRCGQLGNGSTTDSNVPIRIMDNVVAVSCGAFFTAIIKNDGSLWMWGDNDRYQLGNNSNENSSIPVKILDNVAAVSCGSRFAAAIKTDGSLWVWGDNSLGKLGNGGTGNKSMEGTKYFYQTVPLKIMDGVIAVSCGGDHAAAIKSDHSLWVWGNNTNGQVGNGGAGDNLVYMGDVLGEVHQTVPVKILDNVSTVNCGNEITAAIKTDGSLWMWGDDSEGELGIGGGGNALYLSRYPYQTVPVKVMDGAVTASCGIAHTAVIKSDGTLWTFGWDFYGQIGDGRKGNAVDHLNHPKQTIPVKVMDGVLLPAASTQTSAFSDVPANAYYADAAKWAVENNITNGTGGTTFSPAANVNRAQAVTFLWRTQNCPEPKTRTSPFTDVQDTSSWYYKAVLWAAENNITGGTSATTFSPNGNVTRGQMMTFLYRTMGEPGKTGTGAWYADAEKWAMQNGLLNGTAVAYSTNGDCPRSDVVYYLWKTLAS